VRAVLVIAALLGACIAVLLVTAGDDERSSAAAQLPATEITSPPASHDNDIAHAAQGLWIPDRPPGPVEDDLDGHEPPPPAP